MSFLNTLCHLITSCGLEAHVPLVCIFSCINLDIFAYLNKERAKYLQTRQRATANEGTNNDPIVFLDRLKFSTPAFSSALVEWFIRSFILVFSVMMFALIVQSIWGGPVPLLTALFGVVTLIGIAVLGREKGFSLSAEKTYFETTLKHFLQFSWAISTAFALVFLTWGFINYNSSISAKEQMLLEKFMLTEDNRLFFVSNAEDPDSVSSSKISFVSALETMPKNWFPELDWTGQITLDAGRVGSDLSTVLSNRAQGGRNYLELELVKNAPNVTIKSVTILTLHESSKVENFRTLPTYRWEPSSRWHFNDEGIVDISQ